MVAGAAETFSNRTQSAPSVQFEQVDLDHLKKTLVQLGYTADQDKTSIPPEAATLVHRILADLQQAALQYALLAERQQDFPKKDYIDFSGLLESNGGASFLANSSTLGLVDESFMLQAVETARSQIDSLQDKIKELEFKLQSESCSSQTKKAEEDESRRKIESLESSLRDKESRSQTAESNLINFKKNFLEKIERPIVLLSQFAIQSLHAPLGSAYAQRIVHPETLSVRLSSSSGEGMFQKSLFIFIIRS